MGQIQLGPAKVAPAFAKMGLEPGVLFYWLTFLVEGLGGIGILLGLFTRFFAAAVAIEMLVIFCIYWHTGFSWLNRGYEYALLWGSFRLPSHCAAADHIRSIASSECSSELGQRGWIFVRVGGNRRRIERILPSCTETLLPNHPFVLDKETGTDIATPLLSATSYAEQQKSRFRERDASYLAPPPPPHRALGLRVRRANAVSRSGQYQGK